MVIGLLAIAAIPTVTGVGQAISAQKKQNAAAKEQEKFRLSAILEVDGSYREACFCVLKDGKMFLDLAEQPVDGHKFCGYYFKYPSEDQHMGLVSTISDDPPMLNWLFVDKDTHAVVYGGRKETLSHVVGPWGWSDDEAYLSLQGDHCTFVAKQVAGDGVEGWAVYWDPNHKIMDEVGLENCRPLKLHRKPVLGMESRYVRDDA